MRSDVLAPAASSVGHDEPGKFTHDMRGKFEKNVRETLCTLRNKVISFHQSCNGARLELTHNDNVSQHEYETVCLITRSINLNRFICKINMVTRNKESVLNRTVF